MLLYLHVINSEAYLEHCQTSKIEYFAKIVNGRKLLSVFAKLFILDFDKVLNAPLKLFPSVSYMCAPKYHRAKAIIHKMMTVELRSITQKFSFVLRENNVILEIVLIRHALLKIFYLCAILLGKFDLFLK